MSSENWGKRAGRARGRPEAQATQVGSVKVEKIAVAPDVFEIWYDGDTGNISFDYDSAQTGNIDETDTATTVEAAFETATSITACTVTGTGTKKDPFVVTLVTPATDGGALTPTLSGWVHTLVNADRQAGPGDRAPDRP